MTIIETTDHRYLGKVIDDEIEEGDLIKFDDGFIFKVNNIKQENEFVKMWNDNYIIVMTIEEW